MALTTLLGFSGGSAVKTLPAMKQTHSWGWEEPLAEGMDVHSSILAETIPCTGESSRLQSLG